MHFESAAEAKVEYTAMLLGATGNVGGRILHLLVQSPLCKKVVVVTRRNVAELANPKVQQVVVNMDKLEEELAPYARGVDIAFAAFGVGKGSAKMADEEVRKIERIDFQTLGPQGRVHGDVAGCHWQRRRVHPAPARAEPAL